MGGPEVIFAIDPGTRASGIVGLHNDGCRVLHSVAERENSAVSEAIRALLFPSQGPVTFVVEMVEHYGKDIRVGAEVFETCVWIGRYLELAGARGRRLTRRTVKLHLCGSPRATDADIRQAILDRYGGKEMAVGTKKAPGLLYGVKSHAWQALALALTYHDLGDAACYTLKEP